MEQIEKGIGYRSLNNKLDMEHENRNDKCYGCLPVFWPEKLRDCQCQLLSQKAHNVSVKKL